MARTPDKQSKSKRIVFIPTSLEDEKISTDFKTLCLQDDKTQHDLLLEAFQLIFKVHHWPPGNPQLQLTPFSQGVLKVEKCICGKPVGVWLLRLSDKAELKLCKKCFSELPCRYDAKLYHIIRRVDSKESCIQ